MTKSQIDASVAIAISNRWDALVGKMLAHVWEQGYRAGSADGRGHRHLNRNPYKETS